VRRGGGVREDKVTHQGARRARSGMARPEPAVGASTRGALLVTVLCVLWRVGERAKGLLAALWRGPAPRGGRRAGQKRGQARTGRGAAPARARP
jgi:hypothetical protein